VSLFEKPALQRGPVQGQSSHEKKSQLGIVSQPRPPIVGQVPLSRSPEHDSEDVLGSSAGAGTSTQSLAVPELEATKTSDGEAANSLLPATSQFPAQDSDQGLNLNVPGKKLAVPTCAEAQTDLPCQDTINDKASPNVVPTAEEITSVPSQTSIPAAVKPLLFAPEHVAKSQVQETLVAAGADRSVLLAEAAVEETPIPSATLSSESRNALAAIQIRLARGNESEAENSDSSGGWDP